VSDANQIMKKSAKRLLIGTLAVVLIGFTLLNTVRHRFQSMGVPSFPSAELLVFWGGVQTGFNAFGHNPVVYAKALACPALFMHGTDDPRARIEEGRRVYEAVPGIKQFKEFPSIGHDSYVSRYPGDWTETVKGFLKTVRLYRK